MACNPVRRAGLCNCIRAGLRLHPGLPFVSRCLGAKPRTRAAAGRHAALQGALCDLARDAGRPGAGGRAGQDRVRCVGQDAAPRLPAIQQPPK
ncbi:hypothetical protein AMP9_3904 [plant metagenome]|uniref:Uncharacterized protein n=1 Tax=plant metagenome TaxID=1297885 RepID=A0A484P5E6_9ZZZZ